MNNYQAVYDAVRSRFHFNQQTLIDEIARRFDISYPVEAVKQEFLNTLYEQQRPSVLFNVKIIKDGNQWCALYGDNLQEGVAGFGDSPDLAMRNFDKNWTEKIEDDTKKQTTKN